ncbi:MAG: tetratricopeptide repeat protein [Bacteriovoracaceae bacterium]|nr:tetratricopeptide repeat protein [Bacteriovoracaceae bacterium]
MFSKIYVLLPVIMLVALFSCKTSEQIQREQLIDNIAQQMVQLQKLSTDQELKMQEIEQRLSQLTGTVEEKSHKRELSREDNIKRLKEDVELLKEKHQNAIDQLKENQEELTAQKKYLDKVLQTLGKISGVKKVSSYDEAMKLYRKGRYKKARPKLQSLLKNKKIRGNKKARVYHNIGMSDYLLDKHKSAIVYFSKLITKYPKFKYNSNAMFFLGRSFEKLGQKDAAKQTLEELVRRYPRSKKAIEAKKLIPQL